MIRNVGDVETSGELPDSTFNNEDSTPTNNAVNYETTNHVSNMGAGRITYHGEYKPGQFRREIHLDSEVENWTATNTNPSLPEKLMIRVKPVNDGIDTNSALSYGDDLHYKIRVKLNYLVEFKELKDGLRWPVQRQPITITIAQDVESMN